MTEYEKTLEEIKETMGVVLDQFRAIPPDSLPLEWELMKRYAFSETKIPAKYRELIGLAIAASIKCPYCIHFHTRAAKMNGATDEELAELALLTRFTTGWSSILHASDIDLGRFKKQFAEVEAHMTKKAKQKR
jgi:AhpD family alkylhydroperoxidase